MTKRDFFILAIKLFGLFCVIDVLFNTTLALLNLAAGQFSLMSMLWFFVPIVLVLGIFLLLVLKSDRIVSLLRLDRGFDNEEIVLGQLHGVEIVKLGSFIIGGLLIIDNVPSFISYCIMAFQDSVNESDAGSFDKFYWLLSAINILIGLFLMTKYRLVSKLLKTKPRTN